MNPAPRLAWLPASIAEIRPDTDHVSTLVLNVPGWPGHLAGQHLDLRLTSPDDYQAQRSYSIASAPSGETIEITIEEVEGGEVSPFLLNETVVGDVIELRGPIGGYFTWEAGEGGPLLLIGGGSGMAPLMSILRHRVATGDRTPTRLLYSSRTHDSIIYREELDEFAAKDDGFTLTHTLTREQPEGWNGESRRIDRQMLEAAGFPIGEDPRAYVCGPTPLVEAVAADLVAIGYSAERIKTERFGPTGDAK